MLQGAIDYNGDFPGQVFEPVQGFGDVSGLFLRELVEGMDGDVGVAFQHLGELGLVQARKPRGLLKGVFGGGGDHQKEQVTGADALEAGTKRDLTGDPSLQSPCGHVASPLSR